MNKYLIIIISFLLLLLLVQQCNKNTAYLSPKIDFNTSQVVNEIKSRAVKIDSLNRLVTWQKNNIAKLSKVRTNVLNKYFALRDSLKNDSICGDIFLVTDYIITTDSNIIKEQADVINLQSNQIAELNAVSDLKDTIIAKQNVFIEDQHQQIFTIQKQNKREKRRKVFTSIGTFILGVVVGRVSN